MCLLGEDANLPLSIETMLDSFVLKLYGIKGQDINEAWNKMFCTKRSMPEPHQLTPTKDALHWHLELANYTCLIMKSALVCNLIIPAPEGHGWTFCDQNQLQFYLMSLPAAPDAMLDMILCGCNKTKCRTGACSCLSVNLKCTDLCKCSNWENIHNNSDEFE